MGPFGVITRESEVGGARAARRVDSKDRGSSSLPPHTEAIGFPSPDPNSASLTGPAAQNKKQKDRQQLAAVGLGRGCVLRGPDRIARDQIRQPTTSPPPGGAHPPPGHRVLSTLCFSPSGLGCSLAFVLWCLVAWRPACLLSPFPSLSWEIQCVLENTGQDTPPLLAWPCSRLSLGQPFS